MELHVEFNFTIKDGLNRTVPLTCEIEGKGHRSSPDTGSFHYLWEIEDLYIRQSDGTIFPPEFLSPEQHAWLTAKAQEELENAGQDEDAVENLYDTEDS
jgi:hypothetical protein